MSIRNIDILKINNEPDNVFDLLTSLDSVSRVIFAYSGNKSYCYNKEEISDIPYKFLKKRVISYEIRIVNGETEVIVVI